MDDEAPLVTKDIYLAAALLCCGAELDDVNQEDVRHQRFSFTRGACGIPLDQAERDYTNGLLNGSLSRYAESIRRMKSLIHSKD